MALDDQFDIPTAVSDYGGVRTACELPFLNSLVLVKADLYGFMLGRTCTP